MTDGESIEQPAKPKKRQSAVTKQGWCVEWGKGCSYNRTLQLCKEKKKTTGGGRIVHLREKEGEEETQNSKGENAGERPLEGTGTGSLRNGSLLPNRERRNRRQNHILNSKVWRTFGPTTG